MKLSTKNSMRKRYPKLVWFARGKVQRMLAGPPLKTRGSPFASSSA